MTPYGSAALLIAALISLTAGGSLAEDDLVFHAQPFVKIESDANGSTRTELSESKSQEAQVLIVKRGERYLWASRDGRELMHSMSGAFHLFVDARGSGYVKILDPKLMPAEAGVETPLYFEHMSQVLGTITYWGAGTSLSP